MSLWRRVAIEKFPQLRRKIAEADDASFVWFELRQALDDAYRRETLDEKFVSDVYEYASWCLHHRSIDVRSAVVLWFYEHLVDDDIVRSDMARWVSQEDFDMLDFTWKYVLKENAKAFQEEFALRKSVEQGVASKIQRNALARIDQARQAEIHHSSVFRKVS